MRNLSKIIAFIIKGFITISITVTIGVLAYTAHITLPPDKMKDLIIFSVICIVTAVPFLVFLYLFFLRGKTFSGQQEDIKLQQSKIETLKTKGLNPAYQAEMIMFLVIIYMVSLVAIFFTIHTIWTFLFGFEYYSIEVVVGAGLFWALPKLIGKYLIHIQEWLWKKI